jgi:AhpD family alkylhydroperoxidase
VTTAASFPPLTVDTAPAAARPILAASARQFGFLPSPVARVAHAPLTLKHLLAGFAAFDQTSLAPVEREVLAMTVAWEMECHYCMAMHSAILGAGPDAGELVRALRNGSALADERLEALRRYVRAAVRQRGSVPDREAAALHAAGFDDSQALEVVLGVGVYLLSTLLNKVTGAELDAPFAAFAWERPESGQPVAAV